MASDPRAISSNATSTVSETSATQLVRVHIDAFGQELMDSAFVSGGWDDVPDLNMLGQGLRHHQDGSALAPRLPIGGSSTCSAR